MVVWIFIACFAIAAIVGIPVWQNRKSARAGGATPAAADTSPSAQLPATIPTRRPAAIVLGEDAANPAVKFSPLTSDERYRAARPIELNGSLAGRMNSVLQAAPTLLIENAQRGKQLMEVVINGNMIRAADGNGLRAMAVDANGKFSEHARLFSVDKLQELVNVAAVWQIASVVVAQKHLADISEKLDKILTAVDELSRFMDSERRSRITGTHSYLTQVAAAIQAGEIAPAVRAELESCERDLLAAQDHLVSETRGRLSKAIEHKEKLGTETLTEETLARYYDLNGSVDDIGLCIRTRVLAWHVLSLVPGEPHLKQARRSDIERSIEELSKLVAAVYAVLPTDLERIKSRFNLASTIEERKESIRNAATIAEVAVLKCQESCKQSVEQSAELLLTHDEPTVLFAMFEDGKLIEVREAELAEV